MKRLLFTLLLFGQGFLFQLTHANDLNITISDPAIGTRNALTQTVPINFTVSWKNSWRVNGGQNNWDAVWLFVKFRNLNHDYWQHASLTFDSGHSASGATIESSDDTGTGVSKGVFLYSALEKSQGDASYDVTLQWEYGKDNQGDNDTFEVQIFGIEMVYVPTGQFYLGTPDNESYSFHMYYENGGGTIQRNIPYTVDSEDAITIGTTAGNLYYNTSNLSGTLQDGTLPADYPKGYQAFYCMKYEITQSQYADFLNTLSSGQLVECHINSFVLYRNNLEKSGDTYSSSTPSVPQGFMTANNLLSYLDWAALRPMTELEFEKACRGTLPAVGLEFPWGTTDVVTDILEISSGGTENEVISTGYSTTAGNANYYTITKDNINSPTRVGIFADHLSSTGRVTAGATYYGIMDMGGNIFETCVSVANADGRAYTGIHGDGALDNAGNHNTANWPGPYTISDANDTAETGDKGLGQRGGGFRTIETFMYTSARTYAAFYNGGNGYGGGRGVRTAP
ncbi:SUMF1/EgtB/PvdO family nonheme iron enzyme [Flammeovirga sp. EKP202]|uniref:SUMF1/EgtB/PvdO family nonheme iron enzyme n=1 Tax=Flammeovirga sp. EKP202 TaxID=2770592 RepID=UPI00165EEF96|nr:SUMF1/EgtB/PvdO family nonheme iron enzyme [Flammeovirga sp. EKP202]MBD0400264.1 SUMF1/EgtB/PvdO family nonheme iron enzyme [Flammeovirga sp. EKP202]